MAVDFSLLPPEEPVPNDPPSRFMWAIVFFVLVLIGVFVVLMMWPKDLPTHTWKFWTTLILFPVGTPALLVLRRYSSYRARQEDVELRREAAREFNDHVFAVASIPVALIGAAHRFSATHAENTIDGIRAGSIKLKTEAPIARDGEPVKARWLAVPGVVLQSGQKEDDRNRQRAVTKWLFNELLVELANRLQILPSQFELCVHLQVAGGLSYRENESLWNECWREHGLRRAHVEEAAAEFVEVNSLDLWLDHVIEGRGQRARLIVAVQLHPLLSGSPPAGSAEAGVALLLVPDALAREFDVIRTASLYRPVRAALDKSHGALSSALKWANVVAADISGGWQTGLDASKAGALREPAIRLGLTARPTDLDQTVGHAGVAAPWLSIACAASSLAADIRNQLILVGQVESVDCAVLVRDE